MISKICVMDLYVRNNLYYTGTSGSDIDEVDFAEQPSTKQPFQRIIVDHMLVCEDLPSDGE